jgi:hypothetical protein
MIAVVGSLNMDLVIHTEAIPDRGKPYLVTVFIKFPAAKAAIRLPQLQDWVPE